MNRFVRAALVLLLAALAIAAFYRANHTPPRCDHALFSEAAHNCIP